jgi:hypothetical protein
MNGAGAVEITVHVATAGRYRLWVQGPVQRPLRATIDGRPAGVVQDAWSYPQGWTLLSTQRLTAGPHTIRLARSGGRPLPGDGAGGFPVGPAVLERADDRAAGTVRYAPASEAKQLCADPGRYDWIELVRR